MARYIDVEKIHEFVDTKVAEGKDGWATGVPYEWAYALTVIDMQPTADVIPRADVEKIFEEIDHALHDMAMEYHEAGHPAYFAVCEMVHHKVMRPIEKKYIGDKR